MLETTNQPAATESPVDSKQNLHPLDDPQVWLDHPLHQPPAGVDVARCQREIDSIFGVTRDNQPIIKLVWNGDVSFWLEYFMSWDATGRPNAPAVKRPRVKFKNFRDRFGKLIRDVFPPRFLLLARLEPEQYADAYQRESYFFAPEIGAMKQIRPDEPPPVYYLWYATIARHDEFCCQISKREQQFCYGKYAPPQFIYESLHAQKKAQEIQNIKYSPFERIDGDLIRQFENYQNGYRYEVARLKVESEIYVENPMALIGPHAAQRAGIDTPQKARQVVKEYYDRQLQRAEKSTGE